MSWVWNQLRNEYFRKFDRHSAIARRLRDSKIRVLDIRLCSLEQTLYSATQTVSNGSIAETGDYALFATYPEQIEDSSGVLPEDVSRIKSLLEAIQEQHVVLDVGEDDSS